MTNKKRKVKYANPGESYQQPEVKANPLVLQAVGDYYRSQPDLYHLDRNGYVSTLDKPKLVQSVAPSGYLQTSWSRHNISYQDYYDIWGNYLGRVVLDEGDIISLDPCYN